MKEFYCKGQIDGREAIYYIRSFIAWFPIYCQGTLCWLTRVWETWPEIDGKKIYFTFLNGAQEQMYVARFPYDPRKK